MKHLSKVLTARRMFYCTDGDSECVFRVDHIRNKNSVIDITILAKNKEASLLWHSTLITEFQKPKIKLHEVFKRDLPLYVSMKCISNEFTKILRGNNA
jgi:hypothetical protein